MAASVTPQPDPSAIGGVPKAPFVLLPDPERLFQRRAARFAGLAPGHPLEAYLRLLAGVSRAQAAVAAALPAPAALDAERLDRAAEHAMPPIDRQRFDGDAAVRATLRAFFAAIADLPMPPAAADALVAVRASPPDGLGILVGNLTERAVPADAIAPHLFAAAGLQIHAAALAATLPAHQLGPVGTGVCPACGGSPVCSVVVGLPGAENSRYAVCSICATLWNAVRVTCLSCGSTKGIGYRAVDDGSAEATIKAEVCDECHGWLKILYQARNPSLDPVADDVGSLGLDLLMRDTAYGRTGFDPFILGY